MSERPTRILLVRHGLNEYVKTHRLAGWTPGVSLNDLGRAQAAATGLRLAGESLAAVYSSPLERTRETAQAIAEQNGLEPIIRQDVGEADCGEWTGETIESLRETELWRQIQTCPSGARFPGGESFVEIHARMIAALDELRIKHAQTTIAVVSHSDPLKLAIAHYVGLHLDMFQRLVINPASISALSFTPAGPRLEYCNDCAHLPSSEQEERAR